MNERRALIAVLDDEPLQHKVLEGWLTRAGFEVRSFLSGRQALEELPSETAALCLDLNLEDMPGLDVLRHLRAQRPDLPVLVTTARSGSASVVELMRAGAHDYLTKPLGSEVLLAAVERAVDWHQQLMRLREPADGELVGGSAAMAAVQRQIARVSASDATVLILGESGVGKELVAHAIHRQGRRRGGPFVAINCGAIPASLQEAELFGHEKGAFTGAASLGRGCFERAQNGTLFLDEIGEMSASSQVGLLRVLQERKVRRLGGQAEIPIDVRVVAATHRDMGAEVAAGRFRQDLFYRLNVFPMRVPPLRERRDDIPDLIGRFLQELRADTNHQVRRVTPAALDALNRHGWPGNVRELRNVIHRALLAADSDEIDLPHLPAELQTLDLPVLRAPSQPSLGEAPPPILPLHVLERRAIEQALAHTRGNIAQAARLLEMGRATLYRKVQELQLVREP